MLTKTFKRNLLLIESVSENYTNDLTVGLFLILPVLITYKTGVFLFLFDYFMDG